MKDVGVRVKVEGHAECKTRDSRYLANDKIFAVCKKKKKQESGD